MFLINTRDFPSPRPWHPYVLAAQMLVSIPLANTYEILAALSIPFVIAEGRRIRWLAALFGCLLANMPVYLGLRWAEFIKTILAGRSYRN